MGIHRLRGWGVSAKNILILSENECTFFIKAFPDCGQREKPLIDHDVSTRYFSDKINMIYKIEETDEFNFQSNLEPTGVRG